MNNLSLSHTPVIWICE